MISELTGYAPAYISRLRTYNPAFQELVAHYELEAEAVLSDVRAKQQRLGELAVDELTDRLHQTPEAFANRELLEIVDVNLVKAGAAVGNSGNSAAPTQVAIQFITSGPGTLAPLIPESTKLIEETSK